MSKNKKARGLQYLPSPLNNPMLNYSVYYMSAKEKLAYLLLLFLVGGAVGYVFYGGLFRDGGEATVKTHVSNLIVFGIGGLVAVKFLFSAVNDRLKRRRDKNLQKQFMDMLESLSASLSSGNTMASSFDNALKDLRNQYAEGEPIIAELSELLTGVENGNTLETMLADFGKRSNNEDIQNFSNVISNCYRLGGNFNDVVRRTRDIISDKRAVADEIDTKLTSNKLQLNAMCLMPIVLVAMLKLTSQSFADNLASATGVVVTTVAIGIFIGAYLWGRKIIDVR